MARKSDAERLEELEIKMNQIKEKKEQIANRLKEKERKKRTRRLIQMGAIFEKYFSLNDSAEAEKVAFGLQKRVEKNREELLKIDVEKSKEANEIVYEETEESLIIPENPPNEYNK